MSAKYFNRNTGIGLLGTTIFVICLWCRFAPTKLANFSTIMSNTISFASFITCLMFIGLAYLPLQSDSKFMHAMQDLQTSIVIMHQILITITIYFTISVISLFALAFNSIPWVSVALLSLWLALLITGILEVLSLLYELFRIIIYLAQEHKRDSHGY